MSPSSRFHRLAPLSLALLLLAGATAAQATDTYTPSSHTLQIPSLLIGAATYSNVALTVGQIVSGPSGSSPNAAQDSYDPSTGELTVAAVSVGGTVYYNAVVTVQSLQSIGSLAGADTYNGAQLSIPVLQLNNTTYTNVVLNVGLGNVVGNAGGMPAAAADQFYAYFDRLLVPAVQFGSKVYTNVTLAVSIEDLASVGGASTLPVAPVSGRLQSYYVVGTYSSNDADTADSDELADFWVRGCPTGPAVCDYTGATQTLSSAGSAHGGTLSAGAYPGTITSPNTGALSAFELPTLISLTTPAGAAWQGAISLTDIGAELVAMRTDAAATPQIVFGVAPAQGVSNATLSGLSYNIVGIATNPTSGVAGDQGILDTLTFNGTGGFSGTETTNTWNPTTRTGGIGVTAGGVSGTYSVAANGTMSLTFVTGANAPATFTGAMGSQTLVLTNLGTGSGPRALLVGIVAPATSTALNDCSHNPLQGGAFGSGVYQTVGISFNTSEVQTITFNSGSAPYSLTFNGGTLNDAGTIATASGGDTGNYTISGSCFITLSRQTDNLGNIIEYQIGAVTPDGSAFALTDFDTSGGGPLVTAGVRISTVDQLP